MFIRKNEETRRNNHFPSQNKESRVPVPFTLLSGSPVQTGHVLFEFKFTSAQSDVIGKTPNIFNYFEQANISRFYHLNIIKIVKRELDN